MRPGLPAPVARLLAGLASALGELLSIGREMVAIPAQIWLAIAEVAGAFVLSGWRAVVRFGVYSHDRWLDVLEWAQRHVRPAYGVIAVCVAASVALAASQFVDYRGVAVGAPDYSDVRTVAPAPEIGQERTGEAHGWLGIPIAALAVAVTALATRGRWRVARLLVPLGLAAVGVALVVDRPRGLDEGEVGIAYEGAQAVLLEGFWAQLAAGVVLVCCGFLLAVRLRPAGAGAGSAKRAREPGPARSSPLAEPPMGTQGTNP